MEKVSLAFQPSWKWHFYVFNHDVGWKSPPKGKKWPFFHWNNCFEACRSSERTYMAQNQPWKVPIDPPQCGECPLYLEINISMGRFPQQNPLQIWEHIYILFSIGKLLTLLHTHLHTHKGFHCTSSKSKFFASVIFIPQCQCGAMGLYWSDL